jgi:hypothetical protein
MERRRPKGKARASCASAISLLSSLAVSACGNHSTASAEATRADWVARIDYACREPAEKIAVAAAIEPKTLRQQVVFVTRLLPLERELVRAVTDVKGPKPPEGDRAINLMRESLAELAQAYAARRDPVEFRANFHTWQNDLRSVYALDALGSGTCAG